MKWEDALSDYLNYLKLERGLAGNKTDGGARQKAWTDGEWFREGLMAHAQKQKARKIAAE